MTGGTRRQVYLVGVLVIAVAVLVVLRRDSSPSADVAHASRPGTTAAAPHPGTLPVSDIRLERLRAARAELNQAARNPFRFQATAAPAPPPRPAAPPPAAPTAPAAPQGPPPPPPIPLKFIGVLDRAGGVKVAILSDSRGNVFYGNEGAIIDGRFQLLRIGVESADLAYADGRGRQTIRLSGQ